jgi:hypothetical protein
MKSAAASIFSLIFLFLACADHASAATPAGLIAPQHRFVFAGEIHGTVETPALFYKMIEHLAQSERRLAIGLEIPPAEQAAIVDFIRASDDDAPRARQVMLLGKFWNPPGGHYDGRSSKAMLALLESIHTLVASGVLDAQVICFAHQADSDAAAYVARQLEGEPDRRFLALLGNMHAMREPIPGLGNKPLASFFPANQTLSIDVRPNGGTAWVCSGIGKGCGPEELSKNPDNAPCETICFAPLSRDRRFDVAIVLAHVQASPPASSLE